MREQPFKRSVLDKIGIVEAFSKTGRRKFMNEKGLVKDLSF